ncbi:Caffeoylshikimate esterase, partial [Cucurbita argyrosperma subsp. argyrosperma]
MGKASALTFSLIMVKQFPKANHVNSTWHSDAQIFFHANLSVREVREENMSSWKAIIAPKKKLHGIDDELQKLLDANMDDVAARRRARAAFKGIQLSIDHILFKTPSNGLKIEEQWCVIVMAMETPAHFSSKARIARKFALLGYSVFAMDYPGFGLSEGLHGFIPNFDRIVDDVIEHYSKVKENPAFSALPSFLFGQSLGGAVALKIHLKQPRSWGGAVLVAPMCKISDDMIPPWGVSQVLIGASKFLPKYKLVPQKDLAEAAFRDLKYREMTTYNVIAYKHKPRLQTAVEMLRTTQELERRLREVSLPILILHGEADTVTDPSVSKALYEKSSSTDRKLILYEEAWHSLLEGEPDEIIVQVLDDIISWMDERCK